MLLQGSLPFSMSVSSSLVCSGTAVTLSSRVGGATTQNWATSSTAVEDDTSMERLRSSL